MAILLDAYAIVALVRDEAAAETVQHILEVEDASVIALNLAEALDILQRRDGVEERALRVVIEPLFDEGLRLRAVGGRVAWRAAALRSRYYTRRTSEVSLPDCFLVAAARQGDSIATADPPLLAMAKIEGITTVTLPSPAAA